MSTITRLSQKDLLKRWAFAALYSLALSGGAAWPPALANCHDVNDWVELRHTGLGAIHQIAYSPDSVRLAVASSMGVVIWNVEEAAAERLLFEPADAHIVFSVAWSPDGTQIASGEIAPGHAIRIWSVETGALLRILSGNSDFVYSLAWSPDGTQLASGYYSENAIRIWSAETGALLRTLLGHATTIGSVAWSPRDVT